MLRLSARGPDCASAGADTIAAARPATIKPFASTCSMLFPLVFPQARIAPSSVMSGLYFGSRERRRLPVGRLPAAGGRIPQAGPCSAPRRAASDPSSQEFTSVCRPPARRRGSHPASGSLLRPSTRYHSLVRRDPRIPDHFSPLVVVTLDELREL